MLDIWLLLEKLLPEIHWQLKLNVKKIFAARQLMRTLTTIGLFDNGSNLLYTKTI